MDRATVDRYRVCSVASAGFTVSTASAAGAVRPGVHTEVGSWPRPGSAACDAVPEHVAVCSFQRSAMTTVPSPRPVPPKSAASSPLSIDHLRDRLRRYLECRDDVASTIQPSLIVVGFTTNDCHVLRTGLERPEDAIVGFTLPADYGAIGVFAPSVVATPPERLHRHGALALAVTRSGQSVSLLATPDDILDTREPQGWLLDACERAVGMATDPAMVPSLAFPIALWLDRLMIEVLRAPAIDPVTWDDAVELCPVPRRWQSSDPVELGTTLGSTSRSWAAMRASAANGNPSPAAISAAQAAWMDDAMFARWCMGSFPDLANLRSDVEFLAPDAVASRLDIVLRASWSAFAGNRG